MSVYDTVTEQILKELEGGTPPWVQSWQSSLPRNIVSKKEYWGTNVLLLWTAAAKKSYKSPYWLTFKQAGDLHGKVKNVIHGNTRAYYLPRFDQIYLPDPEGFKTMEDYYAVALHEHTHWTGHPSRLNRPLVTTFGTEEYAEEELVAELGSAFLCSHLQVTPILREDHAAYIKSWIKVLKEDRRAIFKASALAAKAADYLREKADKESPAPWESI